MMISQENADKESQLKTQKRLCVEVVGIHLTRRFVLFVCLVGKPEFVMLRMNL